MLCLVLFVDLFCSGRIFVKVIGIVFLNSEFVVAGFIIEGLNCNFVDGIGSRLFKNSIEIKVIIVIGWKEDIVLFGVWM